MPKSILHIWAEAGKILEGIGNSVFTKEHVEQAAAVREAICLSCPKMHHGVFEHCGMCGCSIHLKTRSLSSDCPDGKWPALLSMEEEYQLNQSLHKQKQ